MMRKASTVQMKDINQYLVCSLCGGYYIDATTIMECLHSFCKTCIVRYLETSNYCPKCDVQVHKTRPLLNIRPDLTLQDLVYKLVPGLLTNELKKRRQFYTTRPPGDTEDKQTAHERMLLAEEDKISIALEFSPNGKPSFRYRGRRKKGEKKPENPLDCRYLLCPSDFTIAHIKKFIRMKFGLASELAIDVFHEFEPLGDRYTLLDLAYMFLWRKRSPFKLFYSVYVTGDRARRRKLEQTDKTEEPAEKKPAPPATPVTPSPQPPSTPSAATAKQPTPSALQPPSQPPATKPQPTPDAKQPASKPLPVSTPSSSSAPTPVPMSTAPRTVINKSPLQMKIVAPTERATSAKTSPTQQPPAPAKTPPSNGKPPVARQSSQESQGRPGQAMILPVRLPLSAMMGGSPGTSSPMATNNNNNNSSGKIPVIPKSPVTPKSPITAQHQLPKQVTRDSELKAAHKAHGHKPLTPKTPTPVPSSPGPKSPMGQNGPRLLNDYRSPQKSPSNGQKSPGTPKHDVTLASNKSPMGSKSPPKLGTNSMGKGEKDGRQHPGHSGVSSGTLKTVLPVPHSSSSYSKGHSKTDQPKNDAKAEPKVPPLRIPISRTDLSRTDLSIHHAPIRRPILQHILPKKPKKKESNKSKVDLLQARFGRAPTNGQTLFMNKVHQTTHRAAPHTSASASTSAAAGAASVVARPPHLLMPKPAHMNDNKGSAQLTPPPGPHFQNTNHAHTSTTPTTHNAPASSAAGSQVVPTSAGSHTPAGEQDVPLDLQTPKPVKVS